MSDGDCECFGGPATLRCRYCQGTEEAHRAPVTPIPVSEPPGDDDIVLPMWCRDGDPVNWEPYSRPLRGAEFRTKNSSVTHYLLLRKGE